MSFAVWQGDSKLTGTIDALWNPRRRNWRRITETPSRPACWFRSVTFKEINDNKETISNRRGFIEGFTRHQADFVCAAAQTERYHTLFTKRCQFSFATGTNAGTRREPSDVTHPEWEESASLTSVKWTKPLSFSIKKRGEKLWRRVRPNVITGTSLSFSEQQFPHSSLPSHSDEPPTSGCSGTSAGLNSSTRVGPMRTDKSAIGRRDARLHWRTRWNESTLFISRYSPISYTLKYLLNPFKCTLHASNLM